jgi:hypothetical protein
MSWTSGLLRRSPDNSCTHAGLGPAPPDLLTGRRTDGTQKAAPLLRSPFRLLPAALISGEAAIDAERDEARDNEQN